MVSPRVVVDSGGAAAGKKPLPPALLKRLQARGIAAAAAATEGAAAVPQTGGSAAQPSAEPGLQNGAPAAQPPFAPLASGPQGWLPVVVPTAVACSTLNGRGCVEHMSQRQRRCPHRAHTSCAASGGLPAGWAAALDTRYHTTYFYNTSTGERTWQRPVTQATPALPAGWAEGTDPRSGTAYYYNAGTGVRQWQRPGGEDPVALGFLRRLLRYASFVSRLIVLPLV